MLTGIRVVDLSRVLAGPLATMILGDLGADVVKVERPGAGDETRGWGPPFDERGESAYFLAVNRNKLSLAADLRVAGDVALVTDLISSADVVVDNFRGNALAAHGLDPVELCRRFPRLVWCSITGFGIESNRPGYDFVIQGESGWMAITGEPAGAPMKAGVALADVVAGKDAAVAILAGLVARSSTGAGRRVHISLAASATAALVNVAQNALVSGMEARRFGNAHANLVPYDLFQASDRPIVVAVGTDAQWAALVRALDLTELAGDSRLTTNAGRVANRELVTQTLARRLATAPAVHWRTVLDDAGIPNGLVKSVLEALQSVATDRATGVASSVGGSIRLPPPRLDEHGAVIRRRGWAAFGERR